MARSDHQRERDFYARDRPFGLRYKKLYIRNFPEDDHARFLVKLHADGFTQMLFFEYLIEAYVSEDESLRPILDKMRAEIGRVKADLPHFSEMKAAGEELEDSFGLSDEDKERIYSIEIDGMEF